MTDNEQMDAMMYAAEIEQRRQEDVHHSMTYTTAEAARLLGVAYSTVTYHCRKLALQKHGPAWIIDDAALDRLRSSVVGVRGNPEWTRKES